MFATNPLQIEGKAFDRYSLNLAITGYYKIDGTPEANVAMRLVPTRIENGIAETADAYAKSIVLGSLSEAASDEQVAIGAIQSALQNFLGAKGL